MGFYSYWLDESTRTIHAGGTKDKFKYKKGLTFVDQFLDKESGAGEIIQEIIDRFQLDSTIGPRSGAFGDMPLPPIIDETQPGLDKSQSSFINTTGSMAL